MTCCLWIYMCLCLAPPSEDIKFTPLSVLIDGDFPFNNIGHFLNTLASRYKADGRVRGEAYENDIETRVEPFGEDMRKNRFDARAKDEVEPYQTLDEGLQDWDHPEPHGWHI